MQPIRHRNPDLHPLLRRRNTIRGLGEIKMGSKLSKFVNDRYFKSIVVPDVLAENGSGVLVTCKAKALSVRHLVTEVFEKGTAQLHGLDVVSQVVRALTGDHKVIHQAPRFDSRPNFPDPPNPWHHQ